MHYRLPHSKVNQRRLLLLLLILLLHLLFKVHFAVTVAVLVTFKQRIARRKLHKVIQFPPSSQKKKKKKKKDDADDGQFESSGLWCDRKQSTRLEGARAIPLTKGNSLSNAFCLVSNGSRLEVEEREKRRIKRDERNE